MSFNCKSPSSFSSNSYRGSKDTLWQGGVRVSTFVHSPLFTKNGYVNDNLFHATDWVPTFVAIAAAANNSDHKQNRQNDDNRSGLGSQGIDGFDQMEVLFNNGSTPRTEILLNIDPIRKNEAIIVGDFKLIKGVSDHGRYDGWYPPPPHKKPTADLDLDLDLDLGNKDPRSTLKFNTEKDESDSEKVPRRDLANIEVEGIELVKMQKMMHDDPDVITGIHQEYENLKQDGVIEHQGKMSDENGIVKVNCGPKPANASTNCNLKIEVCLFNIRHDPCEYMNLAKLMPTTAQILMDKINVYRRTMVKPLNKGKDPKGDPALHGGVWKPWL